MFTVRATEAWGAPEDVQAAFLLENKLDLTATTEPVFLGRERGTGHYLWIKCTDGSHDSLARLNREEQLLGRLAHPHILPLIADHDYGTGNYLLYRWQGEHPLDMATLTRMPGVDRARLINDLLDTLHYLQTQSSPVAHGSLQLENLWITPNVHYLRLTGFNSAEIGADNDLLRADRQALLSLLDEILLKDDMPSEAAGLVKQAGFEWLENPLEGYDAFSQALRRILLACVTADL